MNDKCKSQSCCWVAEISPGCWLAPWQGDPGRTLVERSAKRYKSEYAAACALRRARTYRDLHNARIYHSPKVDKTDEPVEQRG